MPKEAKDKKSKKGNPATPQEAMAEQVKSLFSKAKKAGSIDQKDITDAIADTPENADVLDALYTALADAGVQVNNAAVVADEETPALAADAMPDEWALEEGEEEVVVEDQSYLDDIADDSVRLYLREIGKIPLLSAEEEFELAQRIKRGTAAVEELAALDAAAADKQGTKTKEGKA